MDNVRIESLLGNKKVIVGTKYNDLVLETLGKVYIKSGNNFKLLTELIGTLNKSDPKNVLIVSSVTEMESMKYPGDGYFVFSSLNNTLYISYDNRYIKLIEADVGEDLGYVRKSGDTMSGPLEINTTSAPLIVASSELIKNLNSELVGGYKAEDLAKIRKDEIIYGLWSFKNPGVSEDLWTFNKNIDIKGDIILKGSLGSPSFASGFGGYGWRFDADTNTLTVDYLVVRKAMNVYELVVNLITATNGSLWVSNSTTIKEVELPLIVTVELLNYFELNESNALVGWQGTDLLKERFKALFFENKYYLITDDVIGDSTMSTNNDTKGREDLSPLNIGIVKETTSLSTSSTINNTEKVFVNYKYFIKITDIDGLLNSPSFLGKSTFLSENSLKNLSDYIKFTYISKKVYGNTYIETFDKNCGFYAKVQNTKIKIKSYYKYYGLKRETILSAINACVAYFNSTHNKSLNYTVPSFYIITSKDYTYFKPGDVIRCLKFQDNNIKYYDAVVLSLIADKTVIILKADSVFDQYTEVEYVEGDKALYTTTYNNIAYTNSEKAYDVNTNSDVYLNLYETDEERINNRLAEPAIEDDIVLMGNIYDSKRLNAIYITSTDDQSPFIDIIGEVNRPDYSVLYQVPVFKRYSYINTTVDNGYRGVRYNYYLLEPTEENEKIEGVVPIYNENELIYYGTLLPINNSLIEQVNNQPLYEYTSSTKVRVGKLDGITNYLFKDKQPYGYGLYGENVFLTGEFILSNGKSVIEFTKELIKLEISGTVSKNYILLSEGPFNLTVLLVLKKPINLGETINCHWTQVSGTSAKVYLNLLDSPEIKLIVSNKLVIVTNNTYDGVLVELASGESISNIMLSLGEIIYNWEPAELDSVGSTFKMTENGISLMGLEISLLGAIKFSYLNSETLNKFTSLETTINLLASDSKYLFDNLLDATKESTSILGGLIISNTLLLGKTENEEFKIYSGISGQPNEELLGNGISYWSGGSAIDKEQNPENASNPNRARAVIRMDGSGYLADGGLTWTKEGILTADPLSFFVGEDKIGDLLNLFLPIYDESDGETVVGISARYPLFVLGGVTTYAGTPLSIPSIFLGLVLDPNTLTWNEKGQLTVKGGTSGGSDFNSEIMWSLLASSTNELIAKSHLTTAFNGYATESWVQGLGYATQSALNSVSNKLNDFLEGSDTDTIINKWKELEAFLSGMTESDNLAEILSTKADKSFVTSELTKYVTLATEQDITAIKHFTQGLTIGASKHKIYEKDGAVILEGNLLVTGGVTAYSTGEEGGGSSGGLDVDLLWEILGGTGTQQINKTHLTDALNGYATESWVTSKNYATKATTLAGYGITDAYTKTESNNRFVNVSGDTMTGALTVVGKSTTSAFALPGIIFKDNSGRIGTDGNNSMGIYAGGIIALRPGSTDASSGKGLYISTTDIKYNDNKVWHAGNDGSGSGLDADMLDGKHNGEVSGFLNTKALPYTNDDKSNWWCKIATISITSQYTSKGALLLITDGYTVSTSSVYGFIYIKMQQQSSIGNMPNVSLRVFGSIPKSNIEGRLTLTSTSSKLDVYFKETLFYQRGYISFVQGEEDIRNVGGLINALPTATHNILCENDFRAGKLETPRTLWGKSFDGTANVSGDMTGVGSISASGDIVLSQNGTTGVRQIRIQCGDNDFGRIAAGATGNNAGWLEIASADDGNEPIYVRQYTGTFTTLKRTATLLDGNGNTSFPGTVTAPTFNGNATNADKLDGIHASGLFTALSSNTTTNLSLTVGGTTKTIADLYATQAVNSDTVDGYHVNGTSGSVIRKRGYSVASTTATWCRLAKYSMSNTEVLTDVSFLLHSSYNGRFCILNIESRGGEYVRGNIVLSYGIDTSKIRIYYDGTKKNVELYYLAGEGYSVIIAELIYSTERAGWWNNAITMYENDGTSPSYTNYINPTISSLQNNVSSATKLQTPRTLWGKSFDGTANIDGDIINTQKVKSKDSFYLDLYGNAGIAFYTANAIRGVVNSSGNFGIGTTSPSYKLQVSGTTYSNRFVSGFDSGQDNSFSCSNWFRSSGNTGWYNQTYNGGIYMYDTTYVRVSHNKSFWCDEVISSKFLVARGNESSDIYTTYKDNGTLENLKNISNNLSSIRNAINFNWYSSQWYIGNIRSGGIESLGFGIASGTTCYLRVNTNATTVYGNILATGGITCYTSDARAKTIIEELNLSLKQISESPTIRFKWNGWNIPDDNKTHIGGIAQYVQKLLPECILDADGVLNMDYATTAYIYSVQTARHLRKYETKTEKEIRNLKKRIIYLENKLKKLGYEESDTLAN